MTIAPEITVGSLGTMGSSGAGNGAAAANAANGAGATADAGTAGALSVNHAANTSAQSGAARWKQVLEAMGMGPASASQGTDAAPQTTGKTVADGAATTTAAQQDAAKDLLAALQTVDTGAKQNGTSVVKGSSAKTTTTQKKDDGPQDTRVKSASGADAITAAALASQAAVQTVAAAPVSATSAAGAAALATEALAKGSADTVTAVSAVQADAERGRTAFAGALQTAADAGQTPVPAQQNDSGAELPTKQVPAANAAVQAESPEAAVPVQAAQGVPAGTWSGPITSTDGATGATAALETDAAEKSAAAATARVGTVSIAAPQGNAAGTKLNAATTATTGAKDSDATVVDADSAPLVNAQNDTGANTVAGMRAETRSIATAQRATTRVHGTANEAVHATVTGTPAAAQDASASAMVRESGIVTAANANQRGTESQAVLPSSGDSAHAAFAALDSGGSSAATTWGQAGSHTAEAGYRDPVLGWVSVRAQQDAAGVHATVIPVSQDAAQSLGTHLAGLNAYLAEHNSAVSTVAIAMPDASAAGTGQNMSSPSGQGQQNAGQESAPASVSTGTMDRAGTTSNTTLAAIAPLTNGGTYISVLA